MTTRPSRTSAAHRAPLAGVALVAVTALSACGNPFDASELDGASPAGTPQFGEIREEVFSAMLAADSVTISGEVQAGDADLDALFEGVDDDAVGDLQITGAVDGTNSEMSFTAGGNSFTQRAVEGEEYFRGEDFASLLISELDEDIAEAVDESFIEETVADAWVQFTDGGDGSVFSAADVITTWQQELDGEELGSMSAVTEDREGSPVWVYRADEGDTEFVVAAEGEPYLLEVREGESFYQFSDWNESPTPEAPENIITLDEIFAAIAEDQGWPTEEITENNDDSEDAESAGDDSTTTT